MNINDIAKKAPETEDKLDWMLHRQAQLMTRYREIEMSLGFDPRVVPLDLDEAHDQLRVKELTYRVVEELSEATNCLKNKPWKQTPMTTDKQHFLEELSDALHFFLELLLSVGLDGPAIQDLYFRKSEVNLFRQESQY